LNYTAGGPGVKATVDPALDHMNAEIRYHCPGCGAGNGIAVGGDPLPGAVDCRACNTTLRLTAPETLTPGRPPARCAVCGDDKLYIQKDMSQKVGCLVVGVGALLVPWTYGLSLAVCALIDFALYRLLPFITVCYVCASRYRGMPLPDDARPFDLLTAQTYEARSITWRRFNGGGG